MCCTRAKWGESPRKPVGTGFWAMHPVSLRRANNTKKKAPKTITLITRSHPDPVAHRAEAQACISTHRCRNATMAACAQKPQDFSRGGFPKSWRHAFGISEAAGKFADCSGPQTNSLLGIDIFECQSCSKPRHRGGPHRFRWFPPF